MQARFIARFNVVAIVLSCHTLVSAGDLNPPAGPVAPTMKDLDTVEPRIPIGPDTTPGDASSLFRITQPGSYYLTSDVTGVASRNGIEIESDDVIIDLMGFTLRGVPSSLGGIRTIAGQNNLTVRNGVVTAWGFDGVNIVGNPSGNGSLIEGVHALSNNLIGLRCSEGGIIRGCTAALNGSTGIAGDDNSIVESCASRFNGVHGISVGVGSVIRGCSAHDNDLDGIVASIAGVVSDCTTYSNSRNGIAAGDGSTVSNCSAHFNSSAGISTTGGATIQHCTTTSNSGDGILCGNESVILRNSCGGNGRGTGDGAGIHANGTDTRIEGNTCTDNDRGIDVDFAGNLIIRNSCSGNTTNYDIVAGNVGLVVNALVGGAILGNSGGIAPGTTDPNANFTY